MNNCALWPVSRLFYILLPALLFSLCGGAVLASENSSAKSVSIPCEMEVFVSKGCPHCARAKEFLAVLQAQHPELKIVIRDVQEDPAALERLKHIAAAQPGASIRVPTFFVAGQVIVGFSAEAGSGQQILQILKQASVQNTPPFDAPAECAADGAVTCGEAALEREQKYFEINFMGRSVSLEQLGLPLFTLAMGLLDGFNPCSMWVLILMISLLAPMHNRRRMMAIGGTFVAVQGVAYFIFMAAWLNLFLLIGLSRISEIIIAVLALLAGAIHLKDFWRFGRGVTLSIPAAAKPGIYSRMRGIMQASSLLLALSGVLVLALLVQIVELLCTSGLPALYTRILTMQQLSPLSYYGYLALYDLAYMLDDVIVLSIGVYTLSQRRLQEKEGRWLKLISGVVMVGLGVYLLLYSH